MQTLAVPRSLSLADAVAGFKAEVADWARVCMAEESLPTVGDGHDQASYTSAWGCLVHAEGQEDMLPFLKRFRDAIRDHFNATGSWHHGYWRRQEAHHGTEHAEIFLGFLYRADPADDETVRQFLDAAEHIGNWVAGIPPWFDWETGVFRSMHLGTAYVGTDAGERLNVADHLRFINLCLIAHTMSRNSRYLDLARLHGARWADAIVASDSLPAGLLPEGPVFTTHQDTAAAYRKVAGMAGDLQDDVDRAENILASGGVDGQLVLWQKTGDRRFLRAAIRLLDVLATQLGDPDAGAAAQAVRAYRQVTNDSRYDRTVAEALDGTDPHAVTELRIVRRKRQGRRPRGIGKRNDKPDWYDDDRERTVNPILLGLQAEITADEALATRAVDLAWTTFALGRRALDGNRHHGCGADSASAVARGHGRENGAGMVTAVLEPLMQTWCV